MGIHAGLYTISLTSDVWHELKVELRKKYANALTCSHLCGLGLKEMEHDASRRGLVISHSGRTVEVIAEMPTDISIHKLNFQLNTPLVGLSAPHSSRIYIGQLEDNSLLIVLCAVELRIFLIGNYHGLHVRWKVQTGRGNRHWRMW